MATYMQNWIQSFSIIFILNRNCIIQYRIPVTPKPQNPIIVYSISDICIYLYHYKHEFHGFITLVQTIIGIMLEVPVSDSLCFCIPLTSCKSIWFLFTNIFFISFFTVVTLDFNIDVLLFPSI